MPQVAAAGGRRLPSGPEGCHRDPGLRARWLPTAAALEATPALAAVGQVRGHARPQLLGLGSLPHPPWCCLGGAAWCRGPRSPWPSASAALPPLPGLGDRGRSRAAHPGSGGAPRCSAPGGPGGARGARGFPGGADLRARGSNDLLPQCPCKEISVMCVLFFFFPKEV